MSEPREDIRVDAARRQLYLLRAGRWTRRDGLTVTELRLLERLLHGRGRVSTREELLDAVWGGVDGVKPGIVDKHVAALRRKLGAYGRRIKSVYGAGYRLA
jgi:DNA-binding response OmpR family regulator